MQDEIRRRLREIILASKQTVSAVAVHPGKMNEPERLAEELISFIEQKIDKKKGGDGQ